MDTVSAALADVPRRDFLPRGAVPRAGYDAPIHIGHGQTNSQPRTVAAMLRLLQVEPGQRVLDVGAGSGWTTALLGHLVGPEGQVVGVELLPQLAAWGERNLRRTPYDWASIRLADREVVGVPEEGPFDRILVSADAPRLPTVLVDQLDQPGRMVLPVRGTMTLLVRDDAGTRVTQHGSYRFVPLR